jgi:hypothetical protein
VNPETCARCPAQLASPDVESFSLVHWDPATQTNVLVQMFCPEHRPLPAPEWMQREVRR